jgi:hypothetical protein
LFIPSAVKRLAELVEAVYSSTDASHTRPEPVNRSRAALLALRCGSQNVRVSIAAAVILVLLVLVPAVVVLGLFVWAARKDGEEDRAVQARLGIRRRTRLGR